MTKRRLPRRLRKGMAEKWGGTPGEHDEIKPRSRVLRGNMLSGINTELKQGEPEKCLLDLRRSLAVFKGMLG